MKPVAILAAATAPTAPWIAGSPAEAEASRFATDDSERHCVTFALSATQIHAGVRSEITCGPTKASALRTAYDQDRNGEPRRMLSSTVLAVHYTSWTGTGDSLTIYGSSCDGGGVSFSAGGWWNDKIRSTHHRACSDVKHWVDAGYSGASQITTGANWDVVNLNSTLAGQVSSIAYYGS